MKRHPLVEHPERGILVSVLVLCGFGLVMVYSSSAVLGIALANSPSHFFEGQIPKLIAGLALLFCFWHLDYHHLRGHLAWVGVVLAMVILGLVLILHGFRWFRIGPLSVQPSEFARVAVVVFLASYLSRKERLIEIHRRALLVPAAVVFTCAGLIALEPNMSMAVLFVLLALGIFFLAGLPMRWLILGVVVPAVIAVLIMRDYQWDRIHQFLGLGGGDAGYQRDQSITAVGSGGIFGLGLGNGLQKYFFLPFPHTDFILGIVGEETGLFGTTLLLAGYASLILMGISCARRAPDRFGSLLAGGLVWNLAMNVLLHAVVNLGIGPVTGVPLPFLSCGGSSLMANLLAMGILLSVGRRAVRARSRDWTAAAGACA